MESYINTPANKTFTIQHYGNKTVEKFGLGFAVNITGNTEVYTQVIITKL